MKNDTEKSNAPALAVDVGSAFEFDSNSHGPACIEICNDGESLRLVLKVGAHEETLITADRDQWGTFYFTKSSCVAQEDMTRSFLHAYITALTALRGFVEAGTTDSTHKPNIRHEPRGGQCSD